MADYIEYKKKFGNREQFDLKLFTDFEKNQCFDCLSMGRSKADFTLLKQRQQFTGKNPVNETAKLESEVKRRSDKLMQDSKYQAAMERKITIFLEQVNVIKESDDEPDKN